METKEKPRDLMIQNFWHEGLNHSGKADSVCRVEIKYRPLPVVILTDLKENKGTSITNSYELIATKIYKAYLANYPPGEVIWLEHYDKESYLGEGREESFDLVNLEYEDGKFVHPKWQHLKEEDLKELLT